MRKGLRAPPASFTRDVLERSQSKRKQNDCRTQPEEIDYGFTMQAMIFVQSADRSKRMIADRRETARTSRSIGSSRSWSSFSEAYRKIHASTMTIVLIDFCIYIYIYIYIRTGPFSGNSDELEAVVLNETTFA